MNNNFIYSKAEIANFGKMLPIIDFIATPMCDIVFIGGVTYNVIR